MNISKLLAVIILMAVAFTAKAQDAVITIIDRSAQNQPTIVIRSQFDFEQAISLKMKTDPALGASDVLINAISKFGMVDAHGIKITSGFDVDVTNSLVVAFSGGTSEIIRIGQSFYGSTIISSFKDHEGNFVSPPISSLAVYSTNGEKLCFEYENVVKAPPKMVFMLLLDRSGSMHEVMDDVKASARGFLKSLPSNAMCAVSSFNGGFTYHNELYENCNNGQFKLGDLEAQGGTDLYTPLLRAYDSLAQDYFKDYQKAVVIITDGQISPSEALREQVFSAKKHTLSFTYFLGEKEERHLIGLSDVFLKNTSDIKNNLDQYFHSLSTAYKTQKVLNVHQCKGGSYATP